jgi:transcriptional regulator with GAF, ATPase, and Fis domain
MNDLADWNRSPENIVLEIAKIISLSHDDKKSFHSILELIHWVIPFDNATLFVYSNSQKSLKPFAQWGQYVDLLEDFHLGKGKGFANWLAEQKRPLILSNIRRSSYFGEADIHSLMYFPILSRGEVVAIFSCGSSMKGAFTEKHQEILNIINYAIASVVERLKMEQTIKDLNRYLKEKNSQLKKMQKKLIKAERYAAIIQIINSVSHNINNPLAIAQWNLHMVKLSEDELSNEQFEHIYAIEESLTRIQQIVEKLSAVQSEIIDPRSLREFEMIKI